MKKFLGHEENDPADKRIPYSGLTKNFLSVSSVCGFMALNTLGTVLHKKAHDNIINDGASINCCLNRLIVYLSAMALPVIACALMPLVIFNGNATLRRVVYHNLIEPSTCFQVMVMLLKKVHLLPKDRVYPVIE